MARRYKRIHPSQIHVDWDSMAVGASVFIPTVHVRATRARVRRVAKAYDYKLTATQEAVVGGFYGVWVTRTA